MQTSEYLLKFNRERFLYKPFKFFAMVKKILVPTDFSQDSLHALKAAAKLAKRYDAEIFLFHLIELPGIMIDGVNEGVRSELPQAIYFMKLAHQEFEKLMKSPFLEGIKVYEKAEFHNGFEDINTIVQKHEADLIVMGSHGKNGLPNIFIGSSTEKVVRNSKVPVLIIKKDHAKFKLRNFVFASDFQDDNIGPIKSALAIAKREKSTVHLLFVNTPGSFQTTEEIMEAYEAFAEKLGEELPRPTIYCDRTIERGILNFSQLINADLIAIGTHGRKGLAHFFNGSISEDLMHHAKRPVMTFKI